MLVKAWPDRAYADLRQLRKAAVKEGKMDSFTKIFDTKTVKVLAGDIPPGDWEFNMGVS